MPDNNVNLSMPESPARRICRRGFLYEYLRDYTINSTLHGLKYIGEQQRTNVERFFWVVMCTGSVVLCATLINEIWIKWDQRPVIVSFAETFTSVWQIPFPAVTVCSQTKSKQRVYNFTKFFHMQENLENMTQAESHMFQDISLVCDSDLAPYGRETTNFTTVENIINVAPNITDMFYDCMWKDNEMNCTDLFSTTLTDEGQCFTFNTLRADELFRVENLQSEYKYLEREEQSEGWTMEGGYPEGTPLDTYPQRGFVNLYGPRVGAGLIFLLQALESDRDYVCRAPNQGFKIILHNPAESPLFSQQYFIAPFNQDSVIAVKPNMITTSEGLRSYTPTRRLCYFPTERYLRYFKVYTQKNCELECLANFTNARCGCVQCAMPRDESMAICSAGKTDCVTKAQKELVMHEITGGLDGENPVDMIAEAVARECRCLPACVSIAYDSETSHTDYDWRPLFRSFNFSVDEPDTLFARVTIIFKEPQFLTLRRSELYGRTDFLANSGGLLGLFMGFSVLSLVEIVYFITLRLWCWITQDKNVADVIPRNSNSGGSASPQ